MGQNSSMKLIEFQKNYKKIADQFDDYFGSHEVLLHRITENRIIHKVVYLRTDA